MRIIVFSLALIGVMGISACSKCYECKTEVTYTSGGVITKDTLTEDFCTASAQEVEDKEADNYTCSAK